MKVLLALGIIFGLYPNKRDILMAQFGKLREGLYG
ncbi:hypothetical protein V5J35_004198 [Endozoicomonas sp. NE40]|uniref:Uncharacterized protein n=1 Tax=Endozoicomonas lisbonensis TaxID=3120522 RepID=A0ABV2SMM3_9GAMM